MENRNPISHTYVSLFCRAVSQAGVGGGGWRGRRSDLSFPVLRKHLSNVSIHLSYPVDHSDRHLTFLNNTFSIHLSICLLVGNCLLACLPACFRSDRLCLSVFLSACCLPVCLSVMLAFNCQICAK
jgi:hypothetical protein